MSEMGLVLKVLANANLLSGDFADFKQAVQDLFAGKLSKADCAKLLADLTDILGKGLIPAIPGVDMASVQKTITGGKTVATDLMKAVSDVQSSGGVATLVPDLGKAVDDLIAALNQGVVGLTNHNREQVVAVLTEIKQGL